MAVWNIGMYSKSVTESSKSVLVEVLRILGSYRDYLVLTGGWSPYFILEKFVKDMEEHRALINEVRGLAKQLREIKS